MNDVPYDEAVALLASPHACIDYGHWSVAKASPDIHMLTCGLVDSDGSRTTLYIELFVKVSAKTKMVEYRFSVNRHRPFSGRIYQLEVKQSPKPIKDAHQRPHEHMGNKKTLGEKDWEKWSFHEVLAHFMHRTNIRFDPELHDPFEFRLTP